MNIEEKDRLLSLLKYEAEKNYCREVVTIAQGQNLKMGTIVGEKTADGTYKQVSLVDPTDEEATTDGTEIPMGVLLQDVDASTAAQQGLIVARDAIVIESQLIFPGEATADQKKAIKKGLEARGIVTRKSA